MRLGRRTMLLAATAALAGCAPDVVPPLAPEAVPTPIPSPPVRTSPAPEPTPTSVKAAPSPPPVTAAALPGRATIVAEFAGRTPTQWGLEVDGVVLRSQSPSICLTFDACGGSNGVGYDAELIAALVDTETPATLFLNSRWIRANPAIVQDLNKNPLFELANHGTLHTPLSVTERDAYGFAGTGSVAQVYDEVVDNQILMTSLLDSAPRFFRSGTAHFDEVAAEVVRAIGLVPVNFDVNADAGATFTPAQVRSSLLAARPGSICIGHFNRPDGGTAEGVKDALAELKSGGATFSTLSDALG